MKIAVCVKQVPDATVHKRIDPATKRLDRSGEAALNPTDLNAVEEALRIKEAQGGEVVLVSLGPGEGRRLAAQGARDGRRPRGARHRRRRRRAPTSSGRARALAAALEREAADLVLFGQASSDGDGAVLWAAVADRLRRPVVSQVASLTVDVELRHGKAADRARLRRHLGAASRGRRGLGRDQRAAVPVAQGDHGREDEAAGDAVAGRCRSRARRRR